jgi:predicted ArsR family transcriptional regulator
MARGPDYQKDRGERQKQRILELTAAKPMSARDLAGAVYLTVSAVLLHTKAMMRETPRRMHIAALAPTGTGKPTPLYGPGDLPDTIYDPVRKPKLPDRVETRMGQLVELLEQGSCTTEQAAIKMHLSHSRAREYMRRLREMGWAYITDWIKPEGRGDLAPSYALGMRADKPKPRETRAERWRKEKGDAEKYRRILAQRRHLEQRAKLRAKPNTIFGALGL